MKIAVILAILCTAPAALAADAITIGNIRYKGTGCVKGSIDANYANDRSQFSLLFNHSTIEASREARRHHIERHCQLEIPFKIPQGLSIAIANIDYRGFTSVPAGGLSRFRERSAWSRNAYTGPYRYAEVSRIQQVFRGPLDQDFTLSQKAGLILWSPCHAVNAVLRVALFWEVQSNQSKDQSLFSLDSADGELIDAGSGEAINAGERGAIDAGSGGALEYRIDRRPCS